MATPHVDSKHMIKCGHSACSCMVEPSQSYCSDWCAKHSDADGSNEMPGKPVPDKCKCGHPDCKGKH
jgi:hypothetical protein